MAHSNDLLFNDRIAYDDEMNGAVSDDEEGDRIARLLGQRTTLIMGSHGLTTVGRHGSGCLLRACFCGALGHVAVHRWQLRRQTQADA